MNAKLLGLGDGAAVLALVISITPVNASLVTQGDLNWNLRLGLNHRSHLSRVIETREEIREISHSINPSGFELTDWLFTYSPPSQSSVGQFTLDSSNSHIEILYCNLEKQDPGELEVVIRICGATI